MHWEEDQVVDYAFFLLNRMIRVVDRNKRGEWVFIEYILLKQPVEEKI